jgi:hypothetical protein
MEDEHADYSSKGYDKTSYAPPGMPEPSVRPEHLRGSSWDLLSGMKKVGHSYEAYDARHAHEEHLAFADGDLPKDKVSRMVTRGAFFFFSGYAQVSRLYNYLLNVSIVSRWILFIVPVMAILWIPGIVGVVKFPEAHVGAWVCL